jgi:hypothetical protein
MFSHQARPFARAAKLGAEQRHARAGSEPAGMRVAKTLRRSIRLSQSHGGKETTMKTKIKRGGVRFNHNVVVR